MWLGGRISVPVLTLAGNSTKWKECITLSDEPCVRRNGYDSGLGAIGLQPCRGAVIGAVASLVRKVLERMGVRCAEVRTRRTAQNSARAALKTTQNAASAAVHRFEWIVD